jgi:hypothetical protein
MPVDIVCTMRDYQAVNKGEFDMNIEILQMAIELAKLKDAVQS